MILTGCGVVGREKEGKDRGRSTSELLHVYNKEPFCLLFQKFLFLKRYGQYLEFVRMEIGPQVIFPE